MTFAAHKRTTPGTDAAAEAVRQIDFGSTRHTARSILEANTNRHPPNLQTNRPPVCRFAHSAVGGQPSRCGQHSQPESISRQPPAGEAEVLKKLEVEWQHRMAAPLDALLDFEAAMHQAIDRVHSTWQLGDARSSPAVAK